jgi:ribosome-binding protein aMBF1 (putative translation factor)
MNRHNALAAFNKAVQEYVPWHNKNAWNSRPGDKSQQLIADCIAYGVLSEADLADSLKLSTDALKAWFEHGDIPSAKLRKKLKNVLSDAIKKEMALMKS